MEVLFVIDYDGWLVKHGDIVYIVELGDLEEFLVDYKFDDSDVAVTVEGAIFARRRYPEDKSK